MERWESEIVEFKEAKGQYSSDKIGQYFSAISNEANLREKQFGWMILGVSEKGEKHPVGTAFKQGPQHDTDYAAFKDLREETQILWKIKSHIDAALKTREKENTHTHEQSI